MARRTRKPQKSKWARKATRKSRKTSTKRKPTPMTKKEKATFYHLMGGGTVDEDE